MTTAAPTAQTILSNKVYIIYFRKGNKPPEFRIFPFSGDKFQAIERGKAFCAKMDYRFCGVYDCLVDLDKLESMREEENKENFIGI